MYQFPIGVFIQDSNVYTSEENMIRALKWTASLHMTGIQLFALPALLKLDREAPGLRKRIKSAAADLGITVTAICGDLNIKFSEAEKRPELYGTMEQVFDMALEMGTPIVTTHVGVVPDSAAHPRYSVMQDTFGYLARMAEARNAVLANETGPETAMVLKKFLDGIASRACAVNFDPGNIAMSTGEKAEDAARILGHYIVHTHAKDGILIKPCDLEVMYGLKEDPLYRESDYCEEALVGKGQVDWAAYLHALEEIGYRGYLVIERERGNAYAADVEATVKTLRQFLNE